MPGLRCPGPTLTSPYGNYSFLQDVQTPTGKDSTWDRPVDVNFQHLPAGDAVPFVPNMHKACRPPQFYAEWMKGKTGAASNAFSGTGCPMSVSSSSHVNGGNDYDDGLADMVDNFIESGSSTFLDGYDSDGGPPNIAKLCNTLQVYCVVLRLFNLIMVLTATGNLASLVTFQTWRVVSNAVDFTVRSAFSDRLI